LFEAGTVFVAEKAGLGLPGAGVCCGNIAGAVGDRELAPSQPPSAAASTRMRSPACVLLVIVFSLLPGKRERTVRT
jgi:hypothetical protein